MCLGASQRPGAAEDFAHDHLGSDSSLGWIVLGKHALVAETGEEPGSMARHASLNLGGGRFLVGPRDELLEFLFEPRRVAITQWLGQLFSELHIEPHEILMERWRGYFGHPDEMHPALLFVAGQVLVGAVPIRDDDAIFLFPQGIFGHSFPSRVLDDVA